MSIERLEQLYRAKAQFNYADALTRAEHDRKEAIEREINKLEWEYRKPIKAVRREFLMPTVEDACRKIRETFKNDR